MKDMDGNVQRMKAWLMKKVGPTWAVATARNSESKLEIGRGKVPWVEVAEEMAKYGKDSTESRVAQTVQGLTYTFYAFS